MMATATADFLAGGKIQSATGYALPPLDDASGDWPVIPRPQRTLAQEEALVAALTAFFSEHPALLEGEDCG